MNDDSTLIMCITTQMGKNNPDQVVEGCIQVECHKCQEPLLAAPSSQKRLKNPDTFAMCPSCMIQMMAEQNGMADFRVFPETIEEVMQHIGNLPKRRAERN
jgi:RNase P subunit RPR2